MTDEQNKSPPAHSSIPFWIDDDGFIASGSDDSYKTIADPRCLPAPDHADEMDANAAFIVRACNNHYDLLKALSDARMIMRARNLEQRYPATFQDIDATIAKARGQQ